MMAPSFVRPILFEDQQNEFLAVMDEVKIDEFLTDPLQAGKALKNLKATVSSVAEGLQLKEKLPRPKVSARAQAIPKTMETVEKMKQAYAEQKKIQDMIAPYSIASTSQTKTSKDIEIISETPGVRRSLRNKGQLPEESKSLPSGLMSTRHVEIPIEEVLSPEVKIVSPSISIISSETTKKKKIRRKSELENLIDPYGIKETETNPQIPKIPENVEKEKIPIPVNFSDQLEKEKEIYKNGKHKDDRDKEYDADLDDNIDNFEVSFSDQPVPGLNIGAAEFLPPGGIIALGQLPDLDQEMQDESAGVQGKVDNDGIPKPMPLFGHKSAKKALLVSAPQSIALLPRFQKLLIPSVELPGTAKVQKHAPAPKVDAGLPPYEPIQYVKLPFFTDPDEATPEDLYGDDDVSSYHSSPENSEKNRQRAAKSYSKGTYKKNKSENPKYKKKKASIFEEPPVEIDEVSNPKAQMMLDYLKHLTGVRLYNPKITIVVSNNPEIMAYFEETINVEHGIFGFDIEGCSWGKPYNEWNNPKIPNLSALITSRLYTIL